MRKKMIIWIMSILAIVTLSLSVLGMFFGKNEDEKLNGLSGFYDVSAQGTIAYVTYSEGKPEIRLFHPEQSVETKAIELENDQYILNPTFSADGSTIIYISTNKDLEESLESTILQFNLETKENQEIFSVASAITEIEFSPDEESLFYLMAGVFENYSPIASKRPHDFDVHEYRFAEDQHIQHTELKEYSMHSLHIAQDGESVFVRMDEEAEPTPEESFNVHQRIFEISLSNPTERTVVSDPNREVDIFDFAFVPNSKDIIFQSIGNIDSGDTFEYELYKYNIETKEEKQLTNLREYTTNPVISANQNKIYFMVDKRFAKRNSDYHLYQMNLDGTDVKEIQLPNK
ncbi:TolB protein [Mesobacillus persicus]|uniref:TolB protein n=1 Tax=Mesobacillus persicus TaxID=930146 RepID=A0A1H8HHB7_9BACI|nr:PD40 domain-containing protein [Mesobacillus persicus]SEN55439.1 TolB protein [Mesobacillus persicus]